MPPANVGEVPIVAVKAERPSIVTCAPVEETSQRPLMSASPADTIPCATFVSVRFRKFDSFVAVAGASAAFSSVVSREKWRPSRAVSCVALTFTVNGWFQLAVVNVQSTWSSSSVGVEPMMRVWLSALTRIVTLPAGARVRMTWKASVTGSDAGRASADPRPRSCWCRR